ncbi:MAG: hypothetical protein E7Z88_00650 [Cyanobacteria bacterium SIG27]|nr:hypothetical protein [Cyanobacteria bacterium SIG27]
MVDNRGISPIAMTGFKADNASANKMSEEKYGQGGEYFVNEMQEEEQAPQQVYQDRSAQLRASLDSLAMANAGSMMLIKSLKEKEEKRLKEKNKIKNEQKSDQEVEEEEVFED